MSEVTKMKRGKKSESNPAETQTPQIETLQNQQQETAEKPQAVAFDYSDNLKAMEESRIALEAQIAAAKQGIIDDIRLIMDRFGITNEQLRASLEADMMQPAPV